MIRIPTKQPTAAMPAAARVAPVMSGLVYRLEWLSIHADPCTGGNFGTNGFTAKRSTRHLGRHST
jgi:hypothetical protein